MGFCPCVTHFSDVTLENDSDIFVVATCGRWCRCYWAIFRLILHDLKCHMGPQVNHASLSVFNHLLRKVKEVQTGGNPSKLTCRSKNLL